MIVSAPSTKSPQPPVRVWAQRRARSADGGKIVDLLLTRPWADLAQKHRHGKLERTTCLNIDRDEWLRRELKQLSLADWNRGGKQNFRRPPTTCKPIREFSTAEFLPEARRHRYLGSPLSSRMK